MTLLTILNLKDLLLTISSLIVIVIYIWKYKLIKKWKFINIKSDNFLFMNYFILTCIYLNNLDKTYIYQKEVWNNSKYQYIIINDFISYKEAISTIDKDKMTIKEKELDLFYQQKVKEFILKNKLDKDLKIEKTKNNQIIPSLFDYKSSFNIYSSIESPLNKIK